MYKAGIIGCGNIATYIDDDCARKEIWTHSKAYSVHFKTLLTSVCDNDPQKLSKFRGPNEISRYDSYAEMAENENLDIVSICTPTNTHLPIIQDLADCGIKAIFCEKPLSESTENSSKIKEICKTKNIVIGVNFMRRWDPVFKQAKQILESGQVGKIKTITAHTGTALFMSASHLLDMIVFLGGPVKTVYGKLQRDFVRSVHGQDDFGGHAYFELVNGVDGFVKASATSENQLPFEIDVIGTTGRLRIFNYGSTLELSKFEKHQFMSKYQNWRPEIINGKQEKEERMLNAIDDILHCTENGGQPASSADSALQTNQFIDAIYESDRNNAPVSIKY